MRRRGDGEVRRRAQAGANAWRAVELEVADRRISKRLKGKINNTSRCGTSMPVRNGNPGNDRTKTAKAASVRKQLGTKNSKSNEGRQETNGGEETWVHAEELDRDTGEEQAIQWAGHVYM